MLLGQNVNSYGKDTGTANDICTAYCGKWRKIDGLERIRFMTPHPKDLSDELIEVMAESEKICSHMHLPMQSGSTRLLQKMNRHYTKGTVSGAGAEDQGSEYQEVSFTTDIIVGFPGRNRGRLSRIPWMW